MNVFLRMIFQKEHQFEEIPLEGKPLHSVDIKHVCKPCIADHEDLLFDFPIHSVTSLSYHVLSVDHVEAGAIIPVHKK